MSSVLSKTLRIFAISALVLTPVIAQAAVTITSSAPLPPATFNVPYNEQLSATGATSYTWAIMSGGLPTGLSLSPSGVISGTPKVSGNFNFTVQATGSSNSGQATKALTLDVAPFITTTSLPNGLVQSPYSATLSTVQTSGTTLTWSVSGGSLPAGLSINPTSGIISGTPTAAGTSSFTVKATDSALQSSTADLTITIFPLPVITTTSLPNAIQNAAYRAQLAATGTAPFSWTVTGGTLPAGLTLSSGGLLQGTPTTQGSQVFTVTLTDALTSTSRDFTLTVDPPVAALALSPSLPANLTATQPVSNLTLTLAAPHPTALTGQLVMTFTSTAEVSSDDPATEFSSGSRTVGFTIAANATTAVLTGGPISLLTGTVAGTVTLTANIVNGPSNVHVASSTLPAAPPQMTNITATRTAAGFDVQIVGYASSRRVTSAAFTFDLKNGTKTSLSESVDASFATWYKNLDASTQFGSAFSFVQSFNVSGDTTQILDVTVRLTNAQGSTTSGVVKLQ